MPCRRQADASAARWTAAPGRRGCRGPGPPSASVRRGGQRRRRARGFLLGDCCASGRWPDFAAPFAPAAERWARPAVLSTLAKSGGSSDATSAASNFCQMPFSLQQSQRLNSVVRGPYSAGLAPTQPLAKPMQDAANDPAIVHPRLAAEMRKQRLHRRPLRIAQPELPCHDSAPSYSESNPT